MNKNELRNRLDKLGISRNFYSLSGKLLPDRVVLYNSYDKWIVFYFSERGTRDNEKSFSSEDEACRYILELFINSADRK